MSYTIGKLAKLADMTAEGIRYYEKEGLIDAPPRSDNGYRLYDEAALLRLQFIRRAKQRSFSLDEIKLLVHAVGTPGDLAVPVKALAERKVSELDARIAELEQQRDALREVALRCPGTVANGCCPILKDLAEDS